MQKYVPNAATMHQADNAQSLTSDGDRDEAECDP